MQLGFINGVVSVVLRLKFRKLSDGTPYTGLDHTSSGLILAATADNEQGPAAGSGAGFGVAYTVVGSTIETITTPGTYAAPTATKCRFKAVDATNHPGLYEVQLADARWAVSGARSVNFTASGVTDLESVDTVIQLGQITGVNWGNVVNPTTTVLLSGTTLGALSTAERTAIANEVESQIINEADAEQVLTAITNKINTAFADLGSLTLSAIASAVWTRVLTEGYRATGSQGTAEQLLREILHNLTDFSISGTTKTVKKIDGTTAKTYTLNDATNPSSITELS